MSINQDVSYLISVVKYRFLKSDETNYCVAFSGHIKHLQSTNLILDDWKTVIFYGGKSVPDVDIHPCRNFVSVSIFESLRF